MRKESMIAEVSVLTGSSFPIEAIRQQIASALDIIVHLGRLSDKTRKALFVTEVLGYKDGEYQLNELFRFEREEGLVNGKIIGSLQRTENRMMNSHKFIMSGIAGDKWC